MSGVIAAAKRLALAYEGGVSGLAVAMGVNRNTLAHKLARQDGHNLFATELEQMTLHSQQADIAQELAMLCGHVCVPVGAVSGVGDLGRDIAKVGKEFGDVMSATLEAIADGSVTARELAVFDKQFQELLQASMALRAKLKAKIPAPPGELRVAK